MAVRNGAVQDVQTEELNGGGTGTRAALLDPGTRGRARDWWQVVLLVVALTTVLRLPAFFVDVFNSDETFLATQGQVIRDGGDLYREAADRKPPLVPYVYAITQAVTGTTDLWSVRVAAMLAAAGTAVLVAFEARRRAGRTAMYVGAVLTTVALVSFAPQDGQAANFEIFMLPLTVAGVMLARRGRAATSGLAIGLATLAKQTGAATLLPIAWTMCKRRDRRGITKVAVWFAVPLLTAAALLGPRQLVYWTVLGNGSYVGTKTASALVAGMFVVMTLAWAACNVPILWTLRRSWRDRRTPAADGETDADLWLWALSAAISVAVGLRFFGHYYLQLVPPLALLAAVALARSSPRARRATAVLALVLGVMFSAAGYFLTPFGDEPRYRTVSRYVAAHTDRDDRVLVWGNVPEIYWASGVRPATRYIATQSLLAANHPGRVDTPAVTELDPQTWTWFFRDLRRHAPKFIVDTSDTTIRGADRSPVSRYPRFERYVDRHYRFDRTIDGLDVYVRT
jgi:4-amino-4-deoxy-L-arabinose transferase-like glycosyltransferase